MTIEKPALKPLVNSFDENEVEYALKTAFITSLEDALRVSERAINLYGSPHLGDLELMSRFIKEDGFALIRKTPESMQYLFRAWRARNRMRGLHLLRTYLQLLWPNSWTAQQMWHKKNQPYPTALVGEVAANTDEYFLTSRVHVAIGDMDEWGANLISLIPNIRTTLAAKYLLKVYLLRQFANTKVQNNNIGVASAFHARSYIKIDGVAHIGRYGFLGAASAFSTQGAYIQLIGKAKAV